MEETKLMFEVADLRKENEFLKKLLSETKLAMKNAKTCNDEEVSKEILDKAIKVLEVNKVKDLYVLQFDV